MNELHERLKEAAERYVLSLSLPSIERTYCATKDDFLAGAEHGYKEAIALAKEWIKEHTYDTVGQAVCSIHYCYQEDFLNNFESAMNKLLEEKK